MTSDEKGGSADCLFRLLRDGEIFHVHSMLCEAVDFLLAKGIRQWTVPVPRRVVESDQKGQANFCLEVDGRIATFLCLQNEAEPLWADALGNGRHWFLKRLCNSPEFRGSGWGRLAIEEACRYLRIRGAREVHLDCVAIYGLPRYYEGIGFREVARKIVRYPTGEFDMMLMKRNL